MSPGKRTILLILLLVISLWWWSGRTRSHDPGQAQTSESKQVASQPPDATLPTTGTLPAPVVPPSSIQTPVIPEDDRQRVLDAIDNLQFTLRDFAAALGGNPVGTNAEITASLFGDNLKQLKLPISAGSSLNDHGELCDPWGSPWFFHQLSGKQMEIRSAGPDRILHTNDDFVR